MKIKLNASQLRERCLAPESAFWGEGALVETPNKRFYVYRDVGASVLAVGHLDSFTQANHFYVNNIQGGNLIMAAQLDDRLGVHIILDVLPRMGIKTDILLTTDEESGGSTAEYFEPPRQYNWIVEFDRKGEDVVVYSYAGEPWRKAIEAAGFKMGYGSCSDISKMEFMKCKAMNVGIGYDNYHSVFASAWWPTTVAQLRRFHKFYHENRNNYFVHHKQEYVRPANAVVIPYGSYVPAGSPKALPPVVTPPTKNGDSGPTTTSDTPAEQRPLALGLCFQCHTWVNVQEIHKWGRCANCATVPSITDVFDRPYESLDDTGEAIVCPHCRASVTSENYSFRTGMCYTCLLGAAA